MLRYFRKRLLWMIPVLFGVALLIFTMLYLTPGDPVRMIVGEMDTEEEYQAKRDEMGLNDPYIIRFANYLGGILRGDFGNSYTTGQSVTESLLSHYPTTMLLAALSILVAVIIAIPLGILSAVYQDTFVDTLARLVSLVGVSMPNFWQAMIFILIFAVNLKVLPASGFYGPAYWVLPAFTIGIHTSCSILRTTRSSMLETIRQDYIRTARAKGVGEIRVIWIHALRNALIPVLTIVGLRFGAGLGGAVVIESIFSVPGLGKLMVDAIKQRDYPVVQGGVLLIAVSFSLINLLVDMLYAYVDPRIRSQYKTSKAKKQKKEEVS